MVEQRVVSHSLEPVGETHPLLEGHSDVAAARTGSGCLLWGADGRRFFAYWREDLVGVWCVRPHGEGG